jgi:WD repeat-containing protein 48
MHFNYRDRLSASDMIQVRKVIEHVYEKVLGQGSDAGSQAANGGNQEKSEELEDSSAIAEEKVELLCNEQVRKLHLVYDFFCS